MERKERRHGRRVNILPQVEMPAIDLQPFPRMIPSADLQHFSNFWPRMQSGNNVTIARDPRHKKFMAFYKEASWTQNIQ